jgi:hypothetical protein
VLLLLVVIYFIDDYWFGDYSINDDYIVVINGYFIGGYY